MQLFTEAFTVELKYTNLPFFQCLLMMYPYNLTVDISWLHTITGDPDTKVCICGNIIFFAVYFFISVILQKVSETG